jgi:hypothetical protein
MRQHPHTSMCSPSHKIKHCKRWITLHGCMTKNGNSIYILAAQLSCTSIVSQLASMLEQIYKCKTRNLFAASTVLCSGCIVEYSCILRICAFLHKSYTTPSPHMHSHTHKKKSCQSPIRTPQGTSAVLQP